MLFQLAIGSLVISLTVVVKAVFIGVAIRALSRAGPWLVTPLRTYKLILALVAVTLWLLAALSISVWIWAASLISLGAFNTLEHALYFSVVAFTTLGFGDITLPEPWRLLSGISAANGLLLFGLSTAYLVEFLSSLRELRVADHTQRIRALAGT